MTEEITIEGDELIIKNIQPVTEKITKATLLNQKARIEELLSHFD